MRIYVDLDSQEVIRSPGVRDPITELEAKRAPSTRIEVQFTRGATVQELPPEHPHPATTFASSAGPTHNSVVVRYVVSSNTTVYLIGYVLFSGGSMTVTGHIRATRVA